MHRMLRRGYLRRLYLRTQSIPYICRHTHIHRVVRCKNSKRILTNKYLLLRDDASPIKQSATFFDRQATLNSPVHSSKRSVFYLSSITVSISASISADCKRLIKQQPTAIQSEAVGNVRDAGLELDLTKLLHRSHRATAAGGPRRLPRDYADAPVAVAGAGGGLGILIGIGDHKNVGAAGEAVAADALCRRFRVAQTLQGTQGQPEAERGGQKLDQSDKEGHPSADRAFFCKVFKVSLFKNLEFIRCLKSWLQTKHDL